MTPLEFITVSKTPQRIELLGQSIALAMGTAFTYRLTAIDGNTHDLFTGYNAGAAQTTGEILIFIHDDARLLCNALAFGRPLQLLLDAHTGFIGAAGSRLLDTTGMWWAGNLSREESLKNCRGLIFHPDTNEFGIHAKNWPGGRALFGQVLVVDGVLLMCHRRVFDHLQGFDAGTYQGFHFYDVDTTFRAHQLGLKNYAAPLPLLHLSSGKYDEAWEKNRAIFAEKHKAVLPCKL